MLEVRGIDACGEHFDTDLARPWWMELIIDECEVVETAGTGRHPPLHAHGSTLLISAEASACIRGFTVARGAPNRRR
ncbi:Uncharacterised protein [Mycobacteroides abscessus subsp. abscessus]|nr:Uncharacterised protein [Mycobacteroides abscessus subsp. abscessus]